MSHAPVKLHFALFTRSTRPRWLLEELGIPYELALVNMKEGAHKTPEYRSKVHPLGRVPAAEIDGTVLFESSAIIATLADRHLDKGLAPAPDAPARARYYFWLFFGQVTLEPAVSDMMGTFNAAESASLSEATRAEYKSELDDVLSVANQELGAGPWVLGKQFSAADCVVGSVLVWANSKQLLDAHPNLAAYAERVKQRPAFQRARKV
jgi:glutathione S-transferase